MNERELAQEMLNFLNETGQYENFLNFMDNRGFDTTDLENDLTALEDF
jgi:hypothetical protein